MYLPRMEFFRHKECQHLLEGMQFPSALQIFINRTHIHQFNASSVKTLCNSDEEYVAVPSYFGPVEDNDVGAKFGDTERRADFDDFVSEKCMLDCKQREKVGWLSITVTLPSPSNRPKTTFLPRLLQRLLTPEKARLVFSQNANKRQILATSLPNFLLQCLYFCVSPR